MIMRNNASAEHEEQAAADVAHSEEYQPDSFMAIPGIDRELLRGDGAAIRSALDRILTLEALAEITPKGMDPKDLYKQIIRDVLQKIMNSHHTLFSRAKAVETLLNEEIGKYLRLRNAENGVRFHAGGIMSLDISPLGQKTA